VDGTQSLVGLRLLTTHAHARACVASSARPIKGTNSRPLPVDGCPSQDTRDREQGQPCEPQLARAKWATLACCAPPNEPKRGVEERGKGGHFAMQHRAHYRLLVSLSARQRRPIWPLEYRFDFCRPRKGRNSCREGRKLHKKTPRRRQKYGKFASLRTAPVLPVCFARILQLWLVGQSARTSHRQRRTIIAAKELLSGGQGNDIGALLGRKARPRSMKSGSHFRSLSCLECLSNWPAGSVPLRLQLRLSCGTKLARHQSRGCSSGPCEWRISIVPSRIKPVSLWLAGWSWPVLQSAPVAEIRAEGRGGGASHDL